MRDSLEVITCFFNKLEEHIQKAVPMTGLPTGYVQLDRAAHPFMANATFGINIAAHVARNSNKPAAVYSLGTPAEYLMEHMLVACCKLDDKFRHFDRLTDSDWERLRDIVEILVDVPLFIDDTSNLSCLEIWERSKKLTAKKGGLALVVIDSMQLMHPARRMHLYELIISDIFCSLKRMSKELDVPVIVHAHTNLMTRCREKQPILSNLRKVGISKQDVDVILCISRKNHYCTLSERSLEVYAAIAEVTPDYDGLWIVPILH